MLVTKFETLEELNTAGAAFMADCLTSEDSRLLCPATGSSSTGIYRSFIKLNNDVSNLKIIKLDEWASLPPEQPGSCEFYIQQELIKPLNISDSDYISFYSKANDINAECKRIAAELEVKGPIDLCVLGLGLNGHIAFNEPDDELEPGIHLAKLSEASMAHPMVQDMKEKPTHGYTLGLADILRSRAILLVVHGKHKREIFGQLMERKISTQLPASFLWLHNNAHCFYCED